MTNSLAIVATGYGSFKYAFCNKNAEIKLNHIINLTAISSPLI